jgi:hypothetical protein
MDTAASRFASDHAFAAANSAKLSVIMVGSPPRRGPLVAVPHHGLREAGAFEANTYGAA